MAFEPSGAAHSEVGGGVGQEGLFGYNHGYQPHRLGYNPYPDVLIIYIYICINMVIYIYSFIYIVIYIYIHS